MKAFWIHFIKGRLKFGGKGPAPFPSAVVVFNAHLADWRRKNRITKNYPGPFIDTMDR